METVKQISNDEESSIDLLPCHVCRRTFISASLKKHQKICEKHAVKKRKPFDSLKQRVEGTDIVQFHQKAYLKTLEPAQEVVKSPKRSSWKEKHFQLLKSIRAAKGIPSENSTSAMRRTSSFLVDTKRCPSCDRQFGPKAYDRHVEWCKEKKANQRTQNSPAKVLLAKERLEARTKYIPPLNKFRKTPIREKYSNHSPSPGKTESNTSLAAQPSIRRNAKVDSNSAKSREKVDKETKADISMKKTFRNVEEDSARLCDRSNSSLPIVSISLKPESVKSDGHSSGDPFLIAQQQFMDLLKCKHLNTTQTPNNNKITTAVKTSSVLNKQHIPKNTIMQQKTITLNDSLDSLTGDFELMESLVDGNFDLTNNSLSYQKRIPDDEVLDLDPYLINENDNLSLPENFSIEEDSPVSSISTHFLIGSKVETINQQRNNIDEREFSGNILDNTSMTDVRKMSTAPPSANNLSVLSRKSSRDIDNNQKFTKPKLKKKSVFSYSAEKIVQLEKNDNSNSRKKHLKTDFLASIKNATTEDQEKWKGDLVNINSELQSSDFTLKPEDLFAVDDAMYEEFKKYEETYLKGRKEKNSSKKHKPKLIEINYKILTSEEEKQTSYINSKISTDSAYGSLSRSTPEHRTTMSNPLPKEETILDSCELDEPDKGNLTKKHDHHRLPKFCHECGNRYPVTTAKFCVECGIRRLIL